MDVGEHSPRRDGHVRQQLVELLVVANRQLDVAGGDALLLVVAAGVSSELQDLSAEVLSVGRCVAVGFISGWRVRLRGRGTLGMMRLPARKRTLHAESR